jgi:Uma2 family endonuclease
VEILSPSTRRKDLVLKRSKYQDVGVEHYWIVDPAEPSILALSLVNGHYAEVGRAVGDEEFRAELPFPVVIVPSALVG